MRSDIDIKRDVEAELRWNPDIDATDIAVSVKDGVVTLSGFVRSYAQKFEAEQTAKRVNGVRAVANDIEVRLPIFNQRPDPEIARDAVEEIQKNLPYASDHIGVVVRDGGSRSKVRSSGTISGNGRSRWCAGSAALRASPT